MGMGIIKLIYLCVTIVVLLSFKSNSNSVRPADDSLQCILEYTSKCCDLSSLIYVLFMNIAKFHCALRAREQKRLGDYLPPRLTFSHNFRSELVIESLKEKTRREKGGP